MSVNQPLISVVVYTARRDNPFVDRPDLHCYDPVTYSLVLQEFQDFELVLVDALWEQRTEWFKQHPQPYRVKHVPASPNFWHQQGRPGVVSQLNRGLAWADGELVFIGSESCLWPPHFLKLVWDLYSRGMIPVAWYAIADPKPPDIGDRWYPKVPLEMLGYSGQNVCDCDHRAKPFVDDPSLILKPCHHQHYFAYAALPMALAQRLNGFDEGFDGDLHLLDVDLGSRLELAGYGRSIVMHRDLWLVEPRAEDHWKSGIVRKQLLKCGYAQWWYNRITNRYRANTPLPVGWVEDIKRKVCHGACPIRDKCEAGRSGGDATCESHIFPFCDGPETELTQQWLDHIPVFELEDEIVRRAHGLPPYDRSVITG